MRRRAEAGAEFFYEPRLAEARLADDLDELALAAPRALPAAHEQGEVLLAADEGRERPSAASPAAAARPHEAIEDGPAGDALEIVRALVLGDEEARDVALHGEGRKRGSRLRGGLRPRSDIGGVAEHLAGRVDHDGPHVEFDAGGEFWQAPRPVPGVQRVERGKDRERGARGAFGVVLLRLGVAEQGHEAVAEFFQHMPAEMGHRFGSRVEIGARPGRASPRRRVSRRARSSRRGRRTSP